jgi:hypothetical protein
MLALVTYLGKGHEYVLMEELMSHASPNKGLILGIHKKFHM